MGAGAVSRCLMLSVLCTVFPEHADTGEAAPEGVLLR